MPSLLKRFLHKFLKDFFATILHDVFARIVEFITIVVFLILGLVGEYWVLIIALVWGASILAAYHALKSAHQVCKEVAVQIREHKGQVDSRYIYGPSGKRAPVNVSALAVPHRYRPILYGAAGLVLCLCLLVDYWLWERHSKIASNKVAVAPATPPQAEQALRVYVTGLMAGQLYRFWLVRDDAKQYLPADIFTVMRFTNLTSDEIMVDAFNVELLSDPGQAPIKLFLLSPDNAWRTYSGMSTSSVVPSSFDKRFMNDVLREPIGPGHTVYAVGLFQIQHGKSFSHLGGIRLHITDMRGKKYDIDGIIPADSPSGSLEGFTIQNGHPVIDISTYAEQRPAFD